MIWVDGNFLSDDAKIYDINDRIRLGECVFSTILVIDGKPQFWNAHMQKLESNLGVIGFSSEFDSNTLLQAAQELLQQNTATTGRYALNIFVTGGAGANGIREPETRQTHTAIRALPVPAQFPPIHAIIAQNVRRNEGSPLSQIKCANYGENILATREAAAKGANEAILLNNAGNIACASVAAIIMQKGSKLFTPPLSDAAQGGVTRRRAIEKLGAIERSLTPEDLLQSDGLYCVNSLRGCMPVLSLEGQDLPAPTLIPKDFHIE